MSQELEIEYKNLLTQKEFDKLKHHFQLQQHDFFKQHNDYFDTYHFELKQAGAALRIRQKQDQYTLTLKQSAPSGIGLMETHQSIEQKQAEHIIATGVLPEGDVRKALRESNISTDKLQYLGRLSTERAELAYKDGTLVLDHSFYLKKDDYELEYEVSDAHLGRKQFDTLMHEFKLPERPPQNKVQRFFVRKFNGDVES